MGTDDAQLPEHPDCLNCGTELSGQYCGNCGQRARSRLISLWELIQDAFGDLLELDSRLWRTLIPLLIRPGQLTRDSLEGRRARYMPPFRMYLVLSVVFFVVAFFDPRDDLGLLFEPEPESIPEETSKLEEERRSEAQEVLDDLAEDGLISADQAKALPNDANAHFTITDSDDGGVNFEIDPDTGECTLDDEGFDQMPLWVRKRLTRERLEGICERITADGAKTFTGLLIDNIPVALIVLLPFMALVLKGLYPLSRRYFVEHLLFFVHFHAFFFLILTLQILFSRVSGLLWVPEPISVLVIVAASFYIPVYLLSLIHI